MGSPNDETQRLVNDAKAAVGGYHGSMGEFSGSSTSGTLSHSSTSNGSIIPMPVAMSMPKFELPLRGGGGDVNGSASRGEVRATLDDKASLIIVMCVVFLGDTARGIFFPTLWTYVKTMGGDRITLGYCVGAFSLGRVMISPWFGKMSTKHGYRSVLMGASGLIFIGAAAYIVASNNAMLIMAQILLGVGSGTLGVTRAYVADKSTPEQRTYLLAYTTAVQYAGFTCMPFLGGFLSFLLKNNRIPIVGQVIVLNQFTAPAFVMATAASCLLGALYFVFRDSIPKPKKKGKPSEPTAALAASDASAAKYLMGAPSDISLRTNLSDGDDEWPPAELRKNDSSGGPGMFVDSDDEEENRRRLSNASNVSSVGGSASVAGGGNQSYAQLQQQLLQLERDAEQGFAEASKGYQNGDELQPTTVAEAEEEPSHWPIWCYKIRLPSTNDMLIYGGFLLNMSTKGTIACFETLGAEYAMTHFDLTSAEAGSTFATFGSIGVVSLLSMRLLCRYFNDVQIVLGGITVMIVACIMFVPSPEGASGLPFFLVAVFLMYSVGYPIGHTAVLGLFSKVVGAQPQGTLLGWFGSAGSLARIVFPVLAGIVSQELGTSKLFMALTAVLFTTFGILFSFRKPYLRCVEITKRRSNSQSAVKV